MRLENILVPEHIAIMPIVLRLTQQIGVSRLIILIHPLLQQPVGFHRAVVLQQALDDAISLYKDARPAVDDLALQTVLFDVVHDSLILGTRL